MTSQQPFEIGLFTFGEITADPATGRPLDPAVRLREFIDLAVLADQAGLDVLGVGEHHRPDFAIASPPVVLAAVAQATSRIRLTSTVTVLSTADPVKVFEDFTAAQPAGRRQPGTAPVRDAHRRRACGLRRVPEDRRADRAHAHRGRDPLRGAGAGR